MKKLDNQIFQDRRKNFLSQLNGKAAIIPGANLCPTEDCALVKSILPCNAFTLVGTIKRYKEIKNGRN